MMLFLGHQVLREGRLVGNGWEPTNLAVDDLDIDWWGMKPKPPHPLDLMVGDRRSDMGAGWAYGARLYRVPSTLGLHSIGHRWMNEDDVGEAFQP